MEKNTMNAILMKPGKEPVIYALPAEGTMHEEAICDLLEGNYGATEFFPISEDVSLFILTNDLSVALGLKANRRFPGKDKEQIIFGNAIFIAAYNGKSKKEGTITMPEELCTMFIEQIRKNFAACDGTEKPRSIDEVYYEDQDGDSDRAFKWSEIDRPAKLGPAIVAGRVKFYDVKNKEIMEINGRFFKQIDIYTQNTPLS